MRSSSAAIAFRVGAQRVEPVDDEAAQPRVGAVPQEGPDRLRLAQTHQGHRGPRLALGQPVLGVGRGPAAGARPRPIAAGPRATCGRPTRRRGGSPGRPAPGRASGVRRGRGRRGWPPRTAPRSTRRRRTAVRGVRRRAAWRTPGRPGAGRDRESRRAERSSGRCRGPLLEARRATAPARAIAFSWSVRSTAFEATAKARAAS